MPVNPSEEIHMANYAINYDLSKPGRNYQGLIDAIKSYGAWAHVLQSSWVVRSPRTAAQVRDDLLQHIDANDKLVVSTVTGEAAWFNLDVKVSEWLQGVA